MIRQRKDGNGEKRGEEMYRQGDFQRVAEDSSVLGSAVGAFGMSDPQDSLSSLISLIIFDLSAASESIAHAVLLHHLSQHDRPVTVRLESHYANWKHFFWNASSPSDPAPPKAPSCLLSVSHRHAALMADVDDCSAPKIHPPPVIFDSTLFQAAFLGIVKGA